MNLILIIWGVLFILSFVIMAIYARKELNKIVSETGKKEWKLMGGRTNFYRLAVAISLVVSVAVAYLIKYILNL